MEGGVKDEPPTELGADIPSSCWSSFGPTVGERDIGGTATPPLFPPIFIYRIFSHLQSLCGILCTEIVSVKFI